MTKFGPLQFKWGESSSAHCLSWEAAPEDHCKSSTLARGPRSADKGTVQLTQFFWRPYGIELIGAFTLSPMTSDRASVGALQGMKMAVSLGFAPMMSYRPLGCIETALEPLRWWSQAGEGQSGEWNELLCSQWAYSKNYEGVAHLKFQSQGQKHLTCLFRSHQER